MPPVPDLNKLSSNSNTPKYEKNVTSKVIPDPNFVLYLAPIYLAPIMVGMMADLVICAELKARGIVVRKFARTPEGVNNPPSPPANGRYSTHSAAPLVAPVSPPASTVPHPNGRYDGQGRLARGTIFKIL